MLKVHGSNFTILQVKKYGGNFRPPWTIGKIKFICIFGIVKKQFEKIIFYKISLYNSVICFIPTNFVNALWSQYTKSPIDTKCKAFNALTIVSENARLDSADWYNWCTWSQYSRTVSLLISCADRISHNSMLENEYIDTLIRAKQYAVLLEDQQVLDDVNRIIDEYLSKEDPLDFLFAGCFDVCMSESLKNKLIK